MQGQDAGATTQELTTRVNPRWSRKMLIWGAVLLGLCLWGLWDALSAYPSRGARAAEFHEFRYLSELKRAGSLSNQSASVSDPEAVLKRLNEQAGGGGALSPAQQEQQRWLTQLKYMSRAQASNTTYPRTDFRKDKGVPIQVGSADERLAQLEAIWTRVDSKGKTPTVNPLTRWDIPSQWLAFVIPGGVGAVWVALLWMRVRRREYRFNPSTHALTLPTGETLAPQDIEVFDKTRWDKLYINLHIRKDHPRLGGANIELDLFRYVPLEEWVLKMEEVSGKGKQQA